MEPVESVINRDLKAEAQAAQLYSFLNSDISISHRTYDIGKTRETAFEMLNNRLVSEDGLKAEDSSEIVEKFKKSDKLIRRSNRTLAVSSGLLTGAMVADAYRVLNDGNFQEITLKTTFASFAPIAMAIVGVLCAQEFFNDSVWKAYEAKSFYYKKQNSTKN